MERPKSATVAAYNAAVPDDPSAVKGAMFGHPCAFVNGNMFFGTFAQTLIARLGVERTNAVHAAGTAVRFEPMSGRPWKDYVQLEIAGHPAEALRAYATEALAYTAAMPAKVKKAPAPKAKKAPKRG